MHAESYTPGSFLFAQWQHHSARRPRERLIVMDGEDGRTGLSLAAQRQLLSAAFVGTVLNISHEGEIGLSAGPQFQDELPIVSEYVPVMLDLQPGSSKQIPVPQPEEALSSSRAFASRDGDIRSF